MIADTVVLAEDTATGEITDLTQQLAGSNHGRASSGGIKRPRRDGRLTVRRQPVVQT